MSLTPEKVEDGRAAWDLPGGQATLLRGPTERSGVPDPREPSSTFEPVWKFLRSRRALIRWPHRDAHAVAIPVASHQGELVM